MTMPPPPPDRMHLQYQPAPPPQPGPQQMGPGGAYGPAQYAPEQPVPGQMPSPALSMSKPGTITGIQVILYIFLAVSVIGNVFSVMSMVEFFNPFSLISLAFAVYSAIQSLASGVHIARGKRWAWIWSLVSAILGLALSLTGFIYGVIMFDSGGDIMLTVAAVLVALYGTLFGLLCSKSARQWILMHRIQRGEVQMPGTAAGAMPGAAPMGAMAQGTPTAPQRPETRPRSVGVTAAVLGLLAAVAAWRAWAPISAARDFIEWAKVNGAFSAGSYSLFDELFSGSFPQPGLWVIAYVVVLVCAVITIPALVKGSAFGRIFGLIWSIPAVIIGGFEMYFAIDVYNTFFAGSGLLPMFAGPNPFGWRLVADIAFMAGTLVVFIATLTPGVKAWTPLTPAAPLILTVPMGQAQAPQQPGPYAQPQQGGYQQQPYPPRY
jgi:hypothetical protein